MGLGNRSEEQGPTIVGFLGNADKIGNPTPPHLSPIQEGDRCPLKITYGTYVLGASSRFCANLVPMRRNPIPKIKGMGVNLRRIITQSISEQK